MVCLIQTEGFPNESAEFLLVIIGKNSSYRSSILKYHPTNGLMQILHVLATLLEDY